LALAPPPFSRALKSLIFAIVYPSYAPATSEKATPVLVAIKLS